ncbi:uncharacterized protein LOC128957984 [Oppia nitens]|uniref:uncharacterized protein LOC128957984 n=1 Tax=Oppia nitens TaxID=1686743 RepID=UPI0023DCD7C6|nr:uncharacterized protein LOC128957984 [Oppia nitens]
MTRYIRDESLFPGLSVCGGVLLNFPTNVQNSSNCPQIRPSFVFLALYLVTVVLGQSSFRPPSIPAIFAIIRYQNSPCNTESNTPGTCLAQNDCLTRSGTPDGTCASGFASCCNFKFTCGGRTKENETIFVNNLFPRTDNGTNTCQVTIDKQPNVCQLRLDFEEFSLAQPDENGQCTTDSFMVRTTVGERLPILCGDNNNQHLYVDMGRGSANPVVLSVVTNGNNIGRKWKIKINMIPCNNLDMAPSGCLQYFRSPSAVVQSFNYGLPMEGRARYLSNLRYTSCVRVEENFCSIKWETDTLSSFSWGAPFEGNLTSRGASGGLCNVDDFIGIDQGSAEGSGPGEDRICGTKLLEDDYIISRSKPFQLKVRSNSDQKLNAENAQHGFSLRYVQLPCREESEDSEFSIDLLAFLIHKMGPQFVILFVFLIHCLDQSQATNATSRQFWRPVSNIFQPIRLQNTPCNTDVGDAGTCLSETDCRSRGGTGSGQCGRSGLTCCTFKFTCSGKTSSNETLFVNPSYPMGENGTNTCQVTIQNAPDVCQLRLDLEEFSLSPPDDYGRCTKDSFMVRTTVGERLPMLCGENKGQHLYVDMGRGSGNPVVLSVITNDIDFSRKWKIKISLIPCNNYVMAPSGCLQYYRLPSDVIRSFNYGLKVDNKSRYLSNLRYTSCIRVEENFCAIKWMTETENSFSWGASNDPLYSTGNVSFSDLGLTGGLCNDDDYVGIDQGSQEGSGAGEDRFCGGRLFYNNVVISRSKPFQLKVRSNSDQTENARHSQNGFALRYVQLPCVN